MSVVGVGLRSYSTIDAVPAVLRTAFGKFIRGQYLEWRANRRAYPGLKVVSSAARTRRSVVVSEAARSSLERIGRPPFEATNNRDSPSFPNEGKDRALSTCRNERIGHPFKIRLLQRCQF
jgi:hypothetical protein